jgi:hypothetical protein
MESEAKEVYVVFNNHALKKATRNAVTMIEIGTLLCTIRLRTSTTTANSTTFNRRDAHRIRRAARLETGKEIEFEQVDRPSVEGPFNKDDDNGHRAADVRA